MWLPSVAYSAIIGFVPSLAWVSYFALRRKDPMPSVLVWRCAVAGLIAFPVAIALEYAFSPFLGSEAMEPILLGIVEETVKFAAAWIIALRLAPRAPVHAMIYCICVALGFAAIENSLYAWVSAVEVSPLHGLLIGIYRTFTSTPGHVISAAVAGFALGMTTEKNIPIKILAVAAGLSAGIILHSVFDLIIDRNEGTSAALYALPWIWVAFAFLPFMFKWLRKRSVAGRAMA